MLDDPKIQSRIQSHAAALERLGNPEIQPRGAASYGVPTAIGIAALAMLLAAAAVWCPTVCCRPRH